MIVVKTRKKNIQQKHLRLESRARHLNLNAACSDAGAPASTHRP